MIMPIMPTPGRIVWFFPEAPLRDPNGAPLAAIVAKVIEARTVNLAVIGADGTPHARQHVTLLQPGDLLADPDAAHCVWMPYDPRQRCVFIATREGIMRGDLGDWIIRGVKGELYPCKPDIFAATYEPVETP